MDLCYFVSAGSVRNDFVLVKTDNQYLSVIKYIQVGAGVMSCELRSTSDRHETERVVREQRYSRDGIYVSLESNEQLYLRLERIAKAHLRQKVFSKHSKLS